MDRHVVDLVLLDEIRGIAQQGLRYAGSPHDQQRYQRLAQLVSGAYARLTGLAPGEVSQRFARELGYPTAKVGVDAAIFGHVNGDPTVLLIRRAGSGRWALPGGWVDPGETAEQALAREVLEETSLSVSVGGLIAVNSQLPQPDSSPHTSVHLLYHCEPTAGTPGSTAEATLVAYCAPRATRDWHGDHQRWALQAVQWRSAAGDPSKS